MIIELLKAKEKKVMTKRELVFYSVKFTIFTAFLLSFVWTLLFTIPLNDVFLQRGAFVFWTVISFVFLLTPLLISIHRWYNWDRYFPKKLYLNPNTREIKGFTHHEKSEKIIDYLFNLDQKYENRLKGLNEKDKKYLKFVLDSYYASEWLNEIKGTYNVEE